MLVKETRRLFWGKYQYKIVLVCPASPLMRGNDLDNALDRLLNFNINDNKSPIRIKTKDVLDYCIGIVKTLQQMQDYEIRVESPLLTVYTNTRSNIDLLALADLDHVKYISVPSANSNLEHNTVIMPKVDFDFKITVGRTRQNYTTFLNWADQNKKVKVTKSCRRDLTKNTSWGGTHFYVTGDNNLLLIRMMLGGVISKVEKIIKNN
jgi:hypothetical protein